ncbi:MAG: hypothetical protein PHP97_02480 [Candidatus Shapirobacteria bacterium]|nr:hypothetical protein [Candidatus Shapirobacteria bacterium]MDD3002293.1 hypothetical protein [Candidatus Shapirobacteria bacterium]MDD4382702.1 hypothetical protein [Candidatus Shapirobacteria bacterium]
MIKTKKTIKKNSSPKTIKELNKIYIKVPLVGVILFLLLLVAASFAAGFSLVKIKSGDSSTTSTDTKLTSDNIFDADDTEKPELDFYVMSFCPYGNQMETTLRPVFDLLGDKVTIKPRYIFEKIEGDLATYCKNSSPDATNCATYVKNSNGQLKDVTDCKDQIAAMVKKCNNESQYLKIGNNLYTSLHGRIEANQDVRELCAYNVADNKKLWWDFVKNVNDNCTVQNADTCWEEQATKAGLDTNKITECFNKDAATLIEAEIADTTKNKISGSPTLMIGSKNFPPEISKTSTDQNIKIGKEVFTLASARTSNVIKTALCTGFKNQPKECNTKIEEAVAATNGQPAAAVAAGGGCQ